MFTPVFMASSMARVILACTLLVALWLAVWWAVSLP
jgi:hypothetical protein